MIRKGRKYTPEEVFPYLKFKHQKGANRKNFDGDMIKINSLRLNTFAQKGCTCVECGIVGIFLVKEKSTKKDGSYHFNLYAINEDGKEVLMTRDHIKPKSLGGEDTLENSQTMCMYCNSKKGNTYVEE